VYGGEQHESEGNNLTENQRLKGKKKRGKVGRTQGGELLALGKNQDRVQKWVHKKNKSKRGGGKENVFKMFQKQARKQ